MTETQLKAKVLAMLRHLSGCKALKIAGGPMTESGTPDIIGCWHGRCFAVELKVGDNQATQLQKQRLAEWEAGGAIAGVCRSVEEVEKLLLSA
jgi:hypothetical protein